MYSNPTLNKLHRIFIEEAEGLGFDVGSIERIQLWQLADDALQWLPTGAYEAEWIPAERTYVKRSDDLKMWTGVAHLRDLALQIKLVYDSGMLVYGAEFYDT